MEYKILNNVKDDLIKVEYKIQNKLNTDISLIPAIVKYLSNAGGKKLRPLLLLISSKLCGYNNGDRHINLSCAVEFIHVATLLHDDVLDDAQLRRGSTSVNLKWGNKASILAGDFLLSRSLGMVTEDGNIEILATIANTSKSLAEGEILQLVKSNDLSITEDEYLQVLEKKSAMLISACCYIGGILGNTSKIKRECLKKFGYNIGMAFQMIDDLLDYVSTSKELGKKTCNDIKKGIMTLPIIYTYNNATPEDKAKIETLINFGCEEKDLENLSAIMRDYNAIDYTLNKAIEYKNKAKNHLIEGSFEDSSYLRSLFDLADFVIERTK